MTNLKISLLVSVKNMHSRKFDFQQLQLLDVYSVCLYRCQCQPFEKLVELKIGQLDNSNVLLVENGGSPGFNWAKAINNHILNIYQIFS